MENNLDKLFKSKLEGKDPQFHPAAWDRMEALLEDEGMAPRQEKKPGRAAIIFFTVALLGLIFSLVGYNLINSNGNNSEGSAAAFSEEISDAPNLSIEENRKSNTKEIADEFHRNSLNNTAENSTTLNNIHKPIIAHKLASTKITKDKEQMQFNPSQRLLANTNNAKIDEVNMSDFKAYDLSSMLQKKDKENSAQNDYRENSNLNISNKEIDTINSRGMPNNTPVVAEGSSSENNSVKNTAISILEISKIHSLPLARLKRSISDLSLSALKFTLPQSNSTKLSKIQLGIQSTIRFNDGFGYSIGPFVTYGLGNGLSFSIGGQLDVQNFNSGPELSVFDKSYSFGSTLSERKFSLNNQTSIRIPINVHKSMQGYWVNAGVVLYRSLSVTGDIADLSDGSVSQGQSIDNQLVKPVNVGFTAGGSIYLNRYLRAEIGIEIRPKVFSDDQSITNNQNTYYPSLGLRYALFRF